MLEGNASASCVKPCCVLTSAWCLPVTVGYLVLLGGAAAGNLSLLLFGTCAADCAPVISGVMSGVFSHTYVCTVCPDVRHHGVNNWLRITGLVLAVGFTKASYLASRGGSCARSTDWERL